MNRQDAKAPKGLQVAETAASFVQPIDQLNRQDAKTPRVLQVANAAASYVQASKFSAGKRAELKASGASKGSPEQSEWGTGRQGASKGSPEQSERGTAADERWAQKIAGGDAPTFSAGKRATTAAGGRSRCRQQAAAGRRPATCAARSEAELEQARRAVGAQAPKQPNWAQKIAGGDPPTFSPGKRATTKAGGAEQVPPPGGSRPKACDLRSAERSGAGTGPQGRGGQGPPC